MNIDNFQTPYQNKDHDILIEALPIYLEEQSHPEKNQFFYAYSVRITNLGQKPVTLINRHWIIIDGTGERREVQGEGVVGETPKIEPNENFTYQSLCPLKTPTGNMRGHYEFETESGENFRVEIPLFFLRPFDQLGDERGLYRSIESSSIQ